MDSIRSKQLESLADSFYDSFYKKTWGGDEALLKSLSIEEAYRVQD